MVKEFIADHEVKFGENQTIPRELGMKDVQSLTGLEVINFYPWGRWVVFVLSNGIKFHVRSWKGV